MVPPRCGQAAQSLGRCLANSSQVVGFCTLQSHYKLVVATIDDH